MTLLYFLILVLALACFAGAAARKSLKNFDLVALGLFFAFLVPALQYFRQL